MAETRTEYAINGTMFRHGNHVIAIETIPGHETDREWNQRIVEERREWQAAAGITPDAVLVTRIWTATEWF